MDITRAHAAIHQPGNFDDHLEPTEELLRHRISVLRICESRLLRTVSNLGGLVQFVNGLFNLGGLVQFVNGLFNKNGKKSEIMVKKSNFRIVFNMMQGITSEWADIIVFIKV